MAVQDGRALRIKIGGSVIALATSCSLSITGDTLETATKDDTGKWKSKVLSGLSATLTHSGLLGVLHSDLSAHWASLTAGTEFSWEFTDSVATHNKFSGTGVILTSTNSNCGCTFKRVLHASQFFNP